MKEIFNFKVLPKNKQTVKHLFYIKIPNCILIFFVTIYFFFFLSNYKFQNVKAKVP